MKQNIIFTFLTAVILAVGFYAVDIAKLLGFGKDEEKFITAEKTSSNKIYLSNTNTQIAPLRLIQGDTFPADDRSAAAASAMVKAMAKNSEISSISWGIDTDLITSWQVSENDYIFINNWEYIGKRKNKRKLDCIIDSKSLTIVYIRFYDEYSDQPSSANVSRGLEQFDEDSKLFYNSLDVIETKIREEIPAQSQSLNDLKVYKSIYVRDIDELNYRCNYQYSTIKKIMENNFNSKLASFMVSPSLFLNTGIYDENTETELCGVTPILEKIQEFSRAESPEYTAYGSCIYQTVSLKNDRLTIIYNALSNTVEGYFYDGILTDSETAIIN